MLISFVVLTGSSDEGYYYYNSMKKSGKKMGYKSGGKMMGSSSVKMGSMMSGKGKIPSSYWPDPVHDYHSDDSDDVCCLEWRVSDDCVCLCTVVMLMHDGISHDFFSRSSSQI